MKKISIFDFDNTLCLTPEPKEGHPIYKKVTGQDWPHKGWWGREESLDMDIFDIPLNEPVYKKYLHASDTYKVLATGRLSKLRSEVTKILDKYNLVFDEVHLNPGMDTFKFKTDLFEKLIYKFRPDIVTIYDDRQTHLQRFREWTKTKPCDIEIVDVTKL